MRGRLRPAAALISGGRLRFEIAPIVKPGELIDDGHLDRGLQRLAQPIGIALSTNLRAHASKQLVPVDRPNQIIVDPDVQAPKHPRPVVAVRHEKNRKLARPLQGAELAAKPQRIELGQGETDDGEVVAALGRLEQGPLDVAADLHRMVLGQG